MLAYEYRIEFRVRRLGLSTAAIRHCIPRVDCKIHHNLFDLSRIRFDLTDTGVKDQIQ